MFDLFPAAMAQQGGAGGQQSALMSFLPFIIIFAIFYFLMIRPQKKKMEEEQEMLKNLAKGDEVYTKSGLVGTISGQTDKLVTLEVSDGVKVKVLRSQIGGYTSKIFENKEE